MDLTYQGTKNPSHFISRPLPKEQQQIAAFLDWKTGQIDALIARKKELLEKLKEKRLAVITQAVTRGLNPAAPMRDSGIPGSATCRSIGRSSRLGYGQATANKGFTKDERVDGDVPSRVNRQECRFL